MKRFFIYLMVIFLSHSLLAEDDELFHLGGKIHFFNGIDSQSDATASAYTRYVKPNLNAMAMIKTKFSDSVSFESSLTSAGSQTCDNHKLLRTASLTLNLHEFFSLDVGCLKLEQGGWRDRKATSFSPFETVLDHAVGDKKFGKAVNVNFHFIGTFRFQFANDFITQRADGKENQLTLNTAWIMDLFGTEPIFQIGFYNNFKAFHYTLGIKGTLASFIFRADITRDHNVQAGNPTIITQIENAYVMFKAHKFFTPYARYVKKSTKNGKVFLSNVGDHLNDRNWNHQGQTVSFGNQFAFSDQIKAYIATNLKWGEFAGKTKEQLKWNVRLGLRGKI